LKRERPSKDLASCAPVEADWRASYLEGASEACNVGIDLRDGCDVSGKESKDQGSHRPSWIPSSKVLISLVVPVGLIVLVVRERSITHQAAQVLSHFNAARLPWLAVAVICEALSFACYALVQRSLLTEGGARLSFKDMLSLAVAATGLTNILPGGTAPSSGWLVTQYTKRDIPMPLALWAVLAGGYAAVVSMLTLILCGAAIAGLMSPIAIALCAIALIGGSIGFLAAFRQLDALDHWLRAHRLGRFDVVLKKASKRMGDASSFRARPAIGARVMLLSLGNWGLDVGCLIAAFALLGLPIPWRTALFAYALAQAAGSVAPVPAGIGFVEGGMVGAFALAGTPVGGALLATVVYRLITTFGLAGVGSIVLVHLSRQKRTRHASLSGRAAALKKKEKASAR
jgi:putative heme transporter